MPARTFMLEIVTPERLVYAGEVTSVTAPGEQGYFGVWANHAPLLAGLRSGVLTLIEATGEDKRMAVGGGFFEVASNHAILLADAAQFPEEVDAAQEKETLQRARHQMVHPLADKADPVEARNEAEFAAAKLRLIEPS